MHQPCAVGGGMTESMRPRAMAPLGVHIINEVVVAHPTHHIPSMARHEAPRTDRSQNLHIRIGHFRRRGTVENASFPLHLKPESLSRGLVVVRRANRANRNTGP